MLQTRSDSGADGNKRRRPGTEYSNSLPKSLVKYLYCNIGVQSKDARLKLDSRRTPAVDDLTSTMST